MSTEKERCFIITPIGDDTDPIRRHIEGIIDAAITPAMGEHYEIVVAHKISEPGSITKQVITEIYNAKLVVANLTNRNPNVMYELALRHAIGKPAIMIAEKGTMLPSDIIMQRTIFYQNDAKGVLELREELVKAEKDIQFTEKSGPIFDVLGDISHDTNLLQKVEQTDADNIQPFEYILQRLNRIEDAVLHSRRQELRISTPDEYPVRRAMPFKYELINRNYSLKSLKTQIASVERIEPNAHVQDVRIDTNERVLIILLQLTDRINVPEVYHYFIKVLSEFGFVNVVPIDAESCA